LPVYLARNLDFGRYSPILDLRPPKKAQQTASQRVSLS